MVGPLLRSIEHEEFDKAGFILAKTLDESSHHEHHHPHEGEFVWDAAKFAKGFLKGAEVGHFDVPELAECISHERKTEEILKKAAHEIFLSYKVPNKEVDHFLDLKGLKTAAEAMVELVREHRHHRWGDVKEHERPICARLFFSERHHWEKMVEFEKDLFFPPTSLKVGERGGEEHRHEAAIFNERDITPVVRILRESMKQHDFEQSGWILAATLLKERNHHEHHHEHHHHEEETKNNLTLF